MFISFDSVQQIYHGWLSRNRILKPVEGWQYINVPLVKHSRDTLIKDLFIKNNQDWKGKIIRQLEHYKKNAPYYSIVMEFLNHALLKEFETLADLNLHLIKEVCRYLNIEIKAKVYSEMELDIEAVNAPDEWSLNISKKLMAKEYINLPGGQDFFSKEKFTENGVKLSFIKSQSIKYDQKRETFEPGLSIIDVMMFNNRDEINNILDSFEIVN
jgi:hypothetical protein